MNKRKKIRHPASELNMAERALSEIAKAERIDEARLQLRTPCRKRPISIALPPSALGVLIQTLEHLAEGARPVLLAEETQLTTQQAADLLRVSRPYLIKLLESGELPHHKVGRHRRVKLTDVIAYRDELYRQSGEALDELARLSEELGLY